MRNDGDTLFPSLSAFLYSDLLAGVSFTDRGQGHFLSSHIAFSFFCDCVDVISEVNRKDGEALGLDPVQW